MRLSFLFIIFFSLQSRICAELPIYEIEEKVIRLFKLPHKQSHYKILEDEISRHRISLHAAIDPEELRKINDNINKQARLQMRPNRGDLSRISGENFDMGFRYRQLSILFIPLWNWDKEFCGYVSTKKYLPLKPEAVDRLFTLHNQEKPTFVLPLWESIFGKLLLLFLGIFYLIYSALKSGDSKPS